MNAALDDAEVDAVRSDIDGDAADVDETVLVHMIAPDHLSGATRTNSVSLWTRALENGINEPGRACIESHRRAMAIEYVLENGTGLVARALGPGLAVAAPGAGVNVVVVVAMACLELSDG